MTPLRVLLADDHSLVRAGIRSLLGRLPGVEVVGEASDGPEALALAARLLPDVMLLDVAMPGLNGLQVAARVAKELPGVRVVVLSAYANEEYVLQAVNAGVSGYLLKDASPGELEAAVRAAAVGEKYLSPAVSQHVVDDYVQRVSTRPGGTRLSPRQREVLQLIAEGLSTKEIAYRLGLSPKTVETHRGQLMERLEIRDVAGLVRYAIRLGLIPPDA